MERLFDEALTVMTSAFQQIETAVPPPQLTPAQRSLAFRYKEKSIEQALVQKLARVISGLAAANVLLQHGFTQELATLQRTLDEFGEDILFLALPLCGEKRTALHDQYLGAFYEEEIEASGDPLNSPQRRAMIPRKKIRAAIANSPTAPGDPSRHIAVHRTIDKAYSGFVHGASPHIMDMVGGNPLRFHVRGMAGTVRVDEARRDLYNYFYRGLHHVLFVALALRRPQKLADDVTSFLNRFETAMRRQSDS